MSTERYKVSVRRTESRAGNEVIKDATRFLLTVIDTDTHDTYQFTVSPAALAEFLFEVADHVGQQAYEKALDTADRIEGKL